MNVVSGLFSLDPSLVIVMACVIGAVQVAVHILKRAVDLWIDAAEQRPPRVVDGRRDNLQPLPPQGDATWPEMAPLKVVPEFTLASPSVVISGSAELFTLPQPETNGRHAEVDVTRQMDAILDEPISAEEVGVS